MLEKTPFSEAWSLFEMAKAAELKAAEICERMSPTDCEVIPDAPADWYLVHTFPGDDLKALRWLARRRFGVFRPMQQRRLKSAGGQLVQGLEPAFPGWLFVFCWDIKKMYWRIMSCPGVMEILCDPATGKPVPVDQPETTLKGRACIWPRIGFVDKLRALSWVYNDNAPAAGAHRTHSSVRAQRQIKRSARKLGSQERRELQRLKAEAKQIGLWDAEEWDKANKLDPGKRIALLKAELLARSRRGWSMPMDVNPPGGG